MSKLEHLCRFCILPNADLRIAWSEWQDSPLAVMYESVMKEQLPHLKDMEVCYCNKCAELLCQTAHALQMFQRSDTFWRLSSRGNNDQPDAASIYSEGGDIAEISGLDASRKISSEMGAVKLEVGDSDNEKLVDLIEMDDNNQKKNKHEHFWNLIYEDESFYIDPKRPKCTKNDRPNDKKPEKVINTITNKTKRPDSRKTVKRVIPPKVTNEMKLPCSVCDQVFTSRVLLNKHTESLHNVIQCIRCPITTPNRQLMQRHDIEEHKRSLDTISKCPKCDKIFADSNRCNQHIKKTHAPVVTSQCDVCSLIFTNAFRLKNHMKNVHVEAIHECDICKKKFRQKKNLKGHIMNVHVKATKFICSDCGRTFTNYDAWKEHDSKPRPCRLYQVRNYDPNPIFSCCLCDAKFAAVNYGKLHYQNTHKIANVRNVCLICNYLLATPEEMRAHLIEEHSSLSCPVCKRFFKSKITLASHIATHSTKDRPFECKICNATFVKSFQLQDHHKRYHSCERAYKCTDCDLRFVNNCEMLGHWRHKHDPEKKLKCSFCEKRYCTTTELGMHEAIHTGIGKYNCEICSQNFRIVDQLVKHFQRFHPEH